MKKNKGQGEATRLIHSGKADAIARTVGPPIQRGSTVLVPNAAALYDGSTLTYGRMGLASQMALTQALCALEGASHVQLYDSGLAAMTGPMLSILKAGDEVLVVDCIYTPTRRFCDTVLTRFGISTRYFPAGASADAVIAMIGPSTRLIVLESPGSLTFEIQDVPEIARQARARGVLTLIDNTYGAGLLFKPLAHGIDISCQALTKYVGGHSDVFMGSAAVADESLAKALNQAARDHGWSVSPDDAYAMLRGLRTLETRLARHGASGVEIARWLEARPEVERVLHPALPACPGHEFWKRDFTGANGLFSFVLKPGGDAFALLDALELFGLGFSWGGFESLAIAFDKKVSILRTAEPWREAGPLVRLHIGLEDPADLIADLRRGLDAYSGSA
jgi:cystathionine beta-lyase